MSKRGGAIYTVLKMVFWPQPVPLFRLGAQVGRDPVPLNAHHPTVSPGASLVGALFLSLCLPIRLSGHAKRSPSQLPFMCPHRNAERGHVCGGTNAWLLNLRKHWQETQTSFCFGTQHRFWICTRSSLNTRLTSARLSRAGLPFMALSYLSVSPPLPSTPCQALPLLHEPSSLSRAAE